MTIQERLERATKLISDKRWELYHCQSLDSLWFSAVQHRNTEKIIEVQRASLDELVKFVNSITLSI